MTKEITKARIIQEIQDKFGLRELIPERFSFSEMVVPIYDVGPHLTKWESIFEEKSITSASHFLFFTVPENEKWMVNNYNVVFMAAGAYTVTGLYVSRKTAYNIDICYLDMIAGQTVSYAVNLPQPLMLNPKDKLNILIDGYTSTADLRLYINVKKEEIR